MLCRVALGTQIVEQRINSEVLILCSTICVPSATRHNIHMLLKVNRSSFVSDKIEAVSV